MRVHAYTYMHVCFQEPFIDVAVGGNQMPGSNSGSLVVWAVTAHGRVTFINF